MLKIVKDKSCDYCKNIADVQLVDTFNREYLCLDCLLIQNNHYRQVIIDCIYVQRLNTDKQIIEYIIKENL